MVVLIIDSAGTYNAVLSGNRSLTQLTSQSDSINIWPCMLDVGEVGGGGGEEGGLEGDSFYKRFLSRPVKAQFHSHLEIASAKKTLPKYNSAIRPLYNVKHKSTTFWLYKRGVLVWTLS